MAIIIKNVPCAVVEISETKLRDIILNHAKGEIEGREGDCDIANAVVQSDGFRGFIVTFLLKQ